MNPFEFHDLVHLLLLLLVLERVEWMPRERERENASNGVRLM
jgi:hypothetical protein